MQSTSFPLSCSNYQFQISNTGGFGLRFASVRAKRVTRGIREPRRKIRPLDEFCLHLTSQFHCSSRSATSFSNPSELNKIKEVHLTMYLFLFCLRHGGFEPPTQIALTLVFMRLSAIFIPVTLGYT